MAAENSLNRSMDLAIKRYSALFKLPSYKKVILLSGLLCMIIGLLSAVTISYAIESVFKGFILGVLLFIVSLFCDCLINMVILKADAIYDLRRTIALSFFAWLFWLFFIFIGVVGALFFGLFWWLKLLLLGFSAILILRVVVLNSTSSKGYLRLAAASVLQPLACLIPFLFLWLRTSNAVTSSMFVFLALSLVVGFASASLFLLLINRVGKQSLGASSLSFFKAFLLNWIAGLNGPFENLLEELGEEQDVEVSLIKFDSSRPSAVMVIPSVHPGPFKNIGSSVLPYLIKTELERKLGCDVSVPHGLLGHELDLASQLQNQIIIKSVLESARLEAFEREATPFVKVSDGIATACCQMFGEFALLSLSLAPKTTEDFPRELGVFIRQEAEKLRLACCAVVNAHNSIDETTDMQDFMEPLKIVAAQALKKAVAMKKLPFRVGSATVVPRDFSLRDGMGLGGITVTVVEVGKQKIAYVVIDGNNMVLGLREKILAMVCSTGLDDGEVFTTDTHMVNALVLTDRGYCPIGEAIDHDKLVNYVKQATTAAVSKLESAKARCSSLTITKIKVIGAKKLESLCLLVDKAIKRAKKIVAPIFVGSGLLLILFLLFL